jgi:hypothetical protein
VVYSSKYDTSVLFPFWNNDSVQAMLKGVGGEMSAIDAYGPEGVVLAINQPNTFIVLTSSVFIFLYTAVLEFLTIGFGLLALIRQENRAE